LRASFSWWVSDDRIDSNPAKSHAATEELPEVHNDPDRQFWPTDQREALLHHVDEQAHAAMDETPTDRPRAYRDRALAYLLALSGVRAGEVCASSRDDHRNGLRWERVDLDNGLAEVFGKTREWQHLSLIDDVVEVLRRHKQTQAPGTDAWPVFPTGHYPSLSDAAYEQLREEGLTDDEIAALIDEHGIEGVFREREITPPTLSTNGARSVMQRLCDDAGIEVEGEYLKPHGGRRTLGHQLYEEDAVLSQETLRHQSIEITHDAYRDQKAKQRRQAMEEVLDER
jgi:integrase